MTEASRHIQFQLMSPLPAFFRGRMHDALVFFVSRRPSRHRRCRCLRSPSFTTFGDTLWLTAIRAVGEGERLSIDYGNNFYLPTAERQAELEDIYGVSGVSCVGVFVFCPLATSCHVSESPCEERTSCFALLRNLPYALQRHYPHPHQHQHQS